MIYASDTVVKNKNVAELCSLPFEAEFHARSTNECVFGEAIVRAFHVTGFGQTSAFAQITLMATGEVVLTRQL